MSNEIKVGDKVRVREDAPKIYTMYGQTDWESVESTVEKIDGDAAEIKYLNENSDEFDYIAIPTKYLIKVEDEVKEPKFKVNDVVRTVFNETTRIRSVLENGNYYLYGMGNEYPEDSLTLVKPYTEPTEQTEAEKKPNVGSIKIPVEVDLTDGFWDAYTADLAKELALKVANKYNDPEQAADYAVKVAKAVAEGLKRK